VGRGEERHSAEKRHIINKGWKGKGGSSGPTDGLHSVKKTTIPEKDRTRTGSSNKRATREGWGP